MISEEKREPENLIINRLREGSRSAFYSLYKRYHQDVYAYGISLLKSKTVAEDLVQDVFIKVWVKRETLDPTLSIRSFIFTITRNMAFNMLAKAAHHTELKEVVFYKSQDKTESTDYSLLENNYNVLKQKAIERLTPRCRLVFEMSRNEGKSYREISQTLGISENTVKNQISTALADIRNFLKKHGDIVFVVIFLLEFH